MLNVQALTTTLSAMSLPQLQQYAALHKTDPYVVTMALSIANQKKQAMTAMQGQAGQQPMPKVVDQDIAQIAPRAAPMPENVGIGQLPAQNIQNMCGGGIVAFGGGGEVPRYSGVGPSMVGPQYGFQDYLKQLGISTQEFLAASPLDQKNIRESFNATHGAAAGAQPAAAAAPAVAETAAKSPTLWESIKSGLGRIRPGGIVGWELGTHHTALNPNEAAELKKRWDAVYNPSQQAQTNAFGDVGASGEFTSRYPGATGAEGATGEAAPDKGAPNLKGAAPTYGLQPGKGLGLSSSPTTLRSEYEMFMPQGKVLDPYAAEMEEASASQIKSAREYAAQRQRQLEGLGALGADQERRLRAREEKLKGQESELGPMALMQAGFAMMSGSSPFAFQNIGIGAQAGLKTYAEGQDKLQTAKEKLDDAFGRLEMARRSEKMMTDKELAENNREIERTISSAKKDAIAGARMAYGWEKDKANTIFSAYTAERRLGAELESRERLGLAQIAAQKDIAGQRTELMKELYGGQNKAMAEYGKIQKQVMADLAKNSMYVNEPNENKKAAMYNAALQQAMQSNPFLSAYSAGIGFQKAPPPGSKVLELPGASD